MNYPRRTLSTLAALVAAAALVLPASRAEMAVVPGVDGPVSTILMTVVDHPDPVDTAAWVVFRDQPTNLVLNPDGAIRGDGRPDFTVWPATGSPIVVWAYNVGPDHDIALAEWTGRAWSLPEFLTSEMEDDMDPRIVVTADGTVYVAWWTVGNSTGVYVMNRRADGSGWTSPMLVSAPGETARRPSVLFVDGQLLIAYEKDSEAPETAQDVVVAQEITDGSFVRTTIASTERAERLDPILHSAHGQIWLDWKHGTQTFGLAVTESLTWNWSTQLLPDRTWIDVEQSRAQIRDSVLP